MYIAKTSSDLPRNNPIQLAAFYIMTFWSGALEVALPLYWSSSDNFILVIGIGMTAYHLSYFLRDFLVTRNVLPVTLLPFYFLGLLAMWFAFTYRLLVLQIVLVFLLMSTIHFYRFTAKSTLSYNSTVISIMRQFGYVVGGIFATNIVIIMLIGILPFTLLFTDRNDITKANVHKLTNTGLARKHIPLILFELFHSMHYFAYCYTLLAIFMMRLSDYYWLSGFLFMLGWVGYALLFSALKEYQPKTIAIGHLISAVSIGLMAKTNSLTSLVLLWVITGFGGGTNFSARFGVFDKDKDLATYRERTENIGHIIGILVGIPLLKSGGWPLLSISAAVFAAIASLSILFDRSHEIT